MMGDGYGVFLLIGRMVLCCCYFLIIWLCGLLCLGGGY